MNSNVLHDCLVGALEGRTSFPETVRRMHAVGVERYRADLVRLEKSHYSAAGETHLEKIPLEGVPAIPAELSAPEVQSTLADIQRGAIQYPEFLRRIMRAGVTEYMVSIAGKRAIYTGRTGDFYVEPFPEPPPGTRNS